MTEPTAQRWILVADIVGSTQLYEKLGDSQARTLVAEGLELMARAIAINGGQLIKSMGDGVLACFSGPVAVSAAQDMLRNAAANKMFLRVAVHCGEVIEVDGDIFGDAVNTTARIATLSRENELLVSRPVLENHPGLDPAHARSVPPITVKGKREPLQLYTIAHDEKPDDDDMMTMQAEDLLGGVLIKRIQLHHGGQTYELEGSGSLTIGREASCEISVAHGSVSRRHASIFYRAPDFHLSDSSTNGTFLVPANGAPVHLVRRETVLFGHGALYPGARPEAENAPRIEFEVS